MGSFLSSSQNSMVLPGWTVGFLIPFVSYMDIVMLRSTNIQWTDCKAAFSFTVLNTSVQSRVTSLQEYVLRNPF